MCLSIFVFMLVFDSTYMVNTDDYPVLSENDTDTAYGHTQVLCPTRNITI